MSAQAIRPPAPPSRSLAAPPLREIRVVGAQFADIGDDDVAQHFRNTPIIEDAAVTAVLPAGHEHTRAELELQAARQPAHKAAVVDAFRKMKPEDPEPFAGAVAGRQLAPDHIIAHEREGIAPSARSEGSIFGVVSLAQEVALGVAVGAVGVALDLIGYQPNLPQTETAITGLHAMVSLVPAGFGLPGVFLIGFYRLDGVVHGRISRVLARRRQRTSSPPIHTR